MTQRIGAGRPERPIDRDSPFAEFASRLRALRSTAGLGVRDLAGLTGYSVSSISAAASGKSLPSLHLTMAFAASCGADPAAWEELWRQLAAVQQASRVKARKSGERGSPAANLEPENAKPQAALAAISTAPGHAEQPVVRQSNGRHRPLLAEGIGTVQPEARLLNENDSDGSWRQHPNTGQTAVSHTDLIGLAATASGRKMLIPAGTQLVFGRGPAVDLDIAAGRGLSRRAGMVTMMAGGAVIRNISRTHALYVEGEGYQVRLPRMENDGEPTSGWFVCTGTALVGSRAMLDEGQPLVVTVTLASDEAAVPRGASRTDIAVLAGRGPANEVEWTTAVGLVNGSGHTELEDAEPAGGGTLLPFYLDPMTKLFLVALIWCRPWLVDPSATRPPPRTPEIARAALEVTGAYHELERFEADPDYRDLLAARVAEHIKVLRRKIADRGLAAANVRLSDEVAVRILIEHGIITSADLSRLDDPVWRSRQEDLWWTQG